MSKSVEKTKCVRTISLKSSRRWGWDSRWINYEEWSVILVSWNSLATHRDKLTSYKIVQEDIPRQLVMNLYRLTTPIFSCERIRKHLRRESRCTLVNNRLKEVSSSSTWLIVCDLLFFFWSFLISSAQKKSATNVIDEVLSTEMRQKRTKLKALLLCYDFEYDQITRKCAVSVIFWSGGIVKWKSSWEMMRSEDLNARELRQN